MNNRSKIPLEEKNLIIRSDIYILLLKTNPTYWYKKGYLKKTKTYTEKGEKIKYDVTDKAFEDLKNIVVRKRNLESFLKTSKQKLKALKVKRKAINLLNLMEA